MSDGLHDPFATAAGPGARAIVRLEPRDWITNFESNYFPAIDFYDEDFPWRYTPAAPDGTGLKLRPWVALVVLTAKPVASAQISDTGRLSSA